MEGISPIRCSMQYAEQQLLRVGRSNAVWSVTC
jgi:hypothetical protein